MDLWERYTITFTTALTALRVQSYLPEEIGQAPVGDMPESTADFMVSHSVLLLEDLERLQNLLLLARNCLAISAEMAQNFVYEAKFDKVILQYVDHCVRMVARGYDGTPGTRNEVVYTKIVNSCKRTALFARFKRPITPLE